MYTWPGVLFVISVIEIIYLYLVRDYTHGDLLHPLFMRYFGSISNLQLL